jgi:arylsulfatase A-like enzyme
MPEPAVREGELSRMPEYVSESDGADGSKSYVDFLRDPGPPREQGFLQTTESMSAATLRQAMAHTCGMISMIDQKVGQILAALEARGITDDTLILFTSDHGELLGDHGLIRKGPVPYRQLMNVPLIIAGPGVTPGPRQQFTSHLDLKATLLDHLGVEGDSGDGTSFAPLLADPGAAAKDHVIAEYHPRTRPETYNQSLTTADWRLTVYPSKAEWGELFDLGSDPGEHCNLYHDPAYRNIRDDLATRLQSLLPPAPEAGGPSIATY